MSLPFAKEDPVPSLPSSCIPGTRKTVINQITTWLTNPHRSSNCLLLHGPLKSGKSTVARTIWDISQEMGFTSVFLNLSSNTFESPQPTCFLAQAIRNRGVPRKSRIIDTPSYRTELLALLGAGDTPGCSLHHHLCIIDGLCSLRSHWDDWWLIRTLSNHSSKQGSKRSWLFLITSWPAHRTILNAHKRGWISLNILAGGYDEEYRDIKVLLQEGFKAIQQADHRLREEDNWPSSDDISLLVEASSHSVAFSVDCLSFIQQSPSRDPKQTLASLLTLLAGPPFERTRACVRIIEADYAEIIRQIPVSWFPDLQLLISILTNSFPLLHDELVALLRPITALPGSILNILCPLFAVMPVSSLSPPRITLAPVHPSLIECLKTLTPTRSRYTDPLFFHQVMADLCIMSLKKQWDWLRRVKAEYLKAISKSHYYKLWMTETTECERTSLLSLSELWDLLPFPEESKSVETFFDVLDLFRYRSGRIPPKSFFECLYYLQYQHVYHVRSESRSPEDQKLIDVCRDYARPMDLTDYRGYEVLAEFPEFILLGHSNCPFIFIMTLESVTVYSLDDLDEL